MEVTAYRELTEIENSVDLEFNLTIPHDFNMLNLRPCRRNLYDQMGNLASSTTHSDWIPHPLINPSLLNCWADEYPKYKSGYMGIDQQGSVIVISHSWEESEFSKLSKSFNITNRFQVTKYIIKHRYLIDLLLEAKRVIGKYFHGSELYLEILSDPDIKKSNEQLVLNILTDLPVNDAIEKRNRFDKEWWLKNWSLAKGKLCITLEYK